MDESIKKAFEKVKSDITLLNNEVININYNIRELHSLFKNLINKLDEIENNNLKIHQTIQQINSTNINNTTDNPTVPLEIEGLKTPNLDFSIGNRGVQTNRQTNQQTDKPTDNLNNNFSKNIDQDIYEATKILDSLDSLKKEIRLKFKRLTSQEMIVFSTIYKLEDQGNKEITYNLISKTLKLSESSIRDYIRRMLKKGIYIKKEKINNKKLILFISPNLKKIATLPTILKLREL